jgi:selenide,water dikinase
MTTLNRSAAEAATASGVQAATDVTGFGLLGHLGEITHGSSVGARIDHRWVPLLPGVEDLAAEGVVPGGSNRNLVSAAQITRFERLSEVIQIVLADAQTSGGLLLAVSEDRCDDLVAALGEAGTPAAAVIGEIVEGAGITVV